MAVDVMAGHTVEQRAWLDGMRALVDWCEQHPECTPAETESLALLLCTDRRQMTAAAAALGEAEVTQDDRLIRVRRRFGPHVLQVYAVLCERCGASIVNGGWRGMCDVCEEIMLGVQADER